jgi:hypothetical protein
MTKPAINWVFAHMVWALASAAISVAPSAIIVSEITPTK